MGIRKKGEKENRKSLEWINKGEREIKEETIMRATRR